MWYTQNFKFPPFFLISEISGAEIDTAGIEIERAVLPDRYNALRKKPLLVMLEKKSNVESVFMIFIYGR